VGTGGCRTGRPRRIREDQRGWDIDFLERFGRGDRAALTAYTDETLPRGRPGRLRDPHLHRRGRRGPRARAEVWFYQPIPIFAVGCTVAVVPLGAA